MKVKLELPPDTPKEGVTKLKDFIDRAEIDGIERTEIERAPHAVGQMGAGSLLNSIAAIISAATDPLVQLVNCLQKYVDNYRTRITIPTKDGDIVLEHGRSMNPDQVKELVVAIQNNNG
jgi:hypothetical protein